MGDFIRIFTFKERKKPLFLEIKKIFNKNKKLQSIEIFDPVENEEYKQHLINSEHGTTIEINNNKLDFTRYYKLIQYKLTNLPLCDKFRIELNELEIKKDDFNESSWFEKKFDFTLDNIDPTYKSRCSVYVNYQTTIDSFKRGIYLVVNGRVIEKDLYSALYPELTSPGAIAARLRGFIKADYLQKSIQANREDFFDSEIINEIKNKIKAPLNQIIEDYIMQRSTEEKEQKYTDLLQRVEKAKNKFSAPNNYLKQLEINFTSNPEFEQEVVLVIAQLCQKKLLPFQILDYNSSSHIDCVVKWPTSQSLKAIINSIGNARENSIVISIK